MVPTPLVLIEVSPFLLLPTLRAFARRTETFWGWSGGPPVWGDRRGCKRRLATATSFQIYYLSFITRTTCIEEKPCGKLRARPQLKLQCTPAPKTLSKRQ